MKRNPKKKSKIKKQAVSAKRSSKKRKGSAAGRKKLKVQPGTMYYHRQLSEMREDILKTVHRKQEEELPDSEVGDEMDAANQSLERELLFELSDNERMMLDNIEAALRKIEQMRFGICEACNKKISKKRLRVIPHARYCVACQSKSEHSNHGSVVPV